MKLERTPATLLFNPFGLVAGGQALVLGIGMLLLAGWIGWWSGLHFDGVLDAHIGWRGPLWYALVEGVLDWLCMAVLLFAAGKLISRSAFRVIDLAGTQALARWPMLFASVACLPAGVKRFSDVLAREVLKPKPEIPFMHVDALFFLGAMMIILVCTVWMVALMYQSFSVCCNVRGKKAIWTFIGALLLAEVLSKLALTPIVSWAVAASPVHGI
jgi:hypothetical protein